MEDQNKTKRQLINELEEFRQRIVGLEALKNEPEHVEEALRKSEEAAQRLAQENAIVAEIGRIISSTLNIDEVYERFAEEVHKLIPFDRISINTIHREDRIILIAYVFGVEVKDRKQGDMIPFTDPFCGEIIAKRSSILIQAEDESELAKRYPILLSTFQAGLRSMMSVPLISKDEVIGILHLRSTQSNAYSEKDLRLAERVGNQIAGAIANVQLFVERRRAEEALRIEKAYLEQLFESAQESIVMTDNNGIVLRVNNEFTRLFGYASDEAIGKSIDDLVVSDDKGIFKEASSITKHLSEGKAISVETMRQHKDGILIHVSILASPIIIANEQVATYYIYRDITERKRAEEELKKAYMKLKETQAQLIQSEKMASIGQLAAGIAHEINNPAGFIISNLDILNKYVRRITPIFQRYVQLETSLAQYQIPELSHLTQEIKDLRDHSAMDHILTDISQIVSECLEGTHRIKKIVHDLRTFSHAETVEPQYAFVNDLLDFSLNLIWNEIKHKAEVVKEYSDVPKLFCYPQQLRQVFLNILMNAVQAIEKRGKIIIKTYEKNNNIFIEIIDTGCGIPEELQNRIFEPFFTMKEVGKGTGLGLSIVYGIIKKHRGDITVKSKIGEGTNFIIKLPIGGQDKYEG